MWKVSSCHRLKMLVSRGTIYQRRRRLTYQVYSIHHGPVTGLFIGRNRKAFDCPKQWISHKIRDTGRLTAFTSIHDIILTFRIIRQTIAPDISIIQAARQYQSPHPGTIPIESTRSTGPRSCRRLPQLPEAFSARYYLRVNELGRGCKCPTMARLYGLVTACGNTSMEVGN